MLAGPCDSLARPRSLVRSHEAPPCVATRPGSDCRRRRRGPKVRQDRGCAAWINRAKRSLRCGRTTPPRGAMPPGELHRRIGALRGIWSSRLRPVGAQGRSPAVPSADTALTLVLPPAANHTDAFANRLNLAERTREGKAMNRRALVGACLTLVLLVAVGMPATASAAAPARNTTLAAAAAVRVRATIPVSSAFAVATNPLTNTIYVTNPPENTVSVISGRTNTVVATIPVGITPSRVAANPATNTIYVTNSNGGTVSVISGQTNTVVATIPAANPVGIAVNPATNTIYVNSANQNTVSVISGQTNTVVATIGVSGFPQLGLAVNPRTNTIYVGNWLSNTVSVLR